MPRLVLVLYVDESGTNAFECVVSLDSNTVVDAVKLLAGQQHATVDGKDMCLFETGNQRLTNSLVAASHASLTKKY